VEAKRQEVNQLDGYNGNHGDNMVQNLRVIMAALEARKQASPSEALRYAGAELADRGRGGTSQYYVHGLNQAAERLDGHAELSRNDVMTLVQSLLGSVPSEGHPQQMGAGGSVFDQVVGLAGGQLPQSGESIPGSPLEGFLAAQQAQDQEGSLGSVLDGLLEEQPSQDSGDALSGMLGALLGGQPSQGSGDLSASPLGALLGSTPQQGGENPLGGVLSALLGGQPSEVGQPGESRPANLIQTLLPAAMAFLQAKQSGAETPAAMGQALMALLANKRMDPLQAGTPRAAAGGLVAQSMLQALDN